MDPTFRGCKEHCPAVGNVAISRCAIINKRVLYHLDISDQECPDDVPGVAYRAA